LFEEFAGHAAKLPDDGRGVDAGRLAVGAFASGVDAVGGGFELRFEVVEGGPGFGDVRSPLAFEALKFGVRRGVAGEVFLDEARDGAQGGAVVGEV
jgi:hypothetical protein